MLNSTGRDVLNCVPIIAGTLNFVNLMLRSQENVVTCVSCRYFEQCME